MGTVSYRNFLLINSFFISSWLNVHVTYETTIYVQTLILTLTIIYFPDSVDGSRSIAKWTVRWKLSLLFSVFIIILLQNEWMINTLSDSFCRCDVFSYGGHLMGALMAVWTFQTIWTPTLLILDNVGRSKCNYLGAEHFNIYMVCNRMWNNESNVNILLAICSVYNE